MQHAAQRGDHRAGHTLEEMRRASENREDIGRLAYQAMSRGAAAKAFNTVIISAARRGDLDAAGHWFNQALQQNVDILDMSVDAVLSAAAMKGDLARAEIWYTKAFDAGMKVSAKSSYALADLARFRQDSAAVQRWRYRAKTYESSSSGRSSCSHSNA